MRYNVLGRTGLLVSELSLGTMTFGKSQWGAIGGVDQTGAEQIIQCGLDAGVNLLDTADIYSSGQSEEITGAALRNLGVRRHNILVSTKTFGQASGGQNDRGSSRAHILDSLHASLKRMQLDYVDLYQLHGFDPLTPMEESLRALDHLVRQGAVRYIGVSNWAAWQIAQAMGATERLGLSPLSSLQAYYSLAGREIEHEIAPLVSATGLGLICWSPLAGGMLSGKFDRSLKGDEQNRRTTVPFPPVDTERAYDLIDELRGIADSYRASPAKIALAWLLHRKTVSTVLLGAKRVEQLQDNLGATKIELEQSDLDRLDAMSKLASIYPRWMQEVFDGGRSEQITSLGQRSRR
ncbi:aldo/keto reductase [Rhizobium sp. Root274]|uniref:aldo/keto reductase n=1 Tax=unclassified Rhizobium TaxID=2613769 RepID=UPI000713D358|nr:MULTISPECIES: aldo/keto reductase [unclassified Rhizobium]KQW30250.1 aldo/keto reductase [Rhizobium sp. Root1240]KRD31741.1 aldo/keto reductase [Rhizobium sp. Root274]